MAVFGVLTKLATQTTDPIWVSFITYLTGAVITTFLIAPQGLSGLKSQQYSYLFARAIIGTIASFLYMLSMHYIPIVNSTLLFNTAPVFIPILSVIWLKHFIRTSIWLAVVVGFIGILFIIKPSIATLKDPGNIIGLMSVIALAIAYLLMKILTANNSGLRIIFYYLSIGTLMQLPLLWFADNTFTMQTLFIASLCGVALLIAQLSLVKAYTYASASEVGVYQYSSVVFVGIIEWLLWSVMPDFSSIIGFVLVTLAGVVIIHSGSRQ